MTGMHNTSELRTPNHKRILAHNIRQTIDSMTDSEKQHTLAHIKSRIFMGHEVDAQTCQYITSLLEGKRPKNGLSH